MNKITEIIMRDVGNPELTEKDLVEIDEVAQEMASKWFE